MYSSLHDKFRDRSCIRGLPSEILARRNDERRDKTQTQGVTTRAVIKRSTLEGQIAALDLFCYFFRCSQNVPSHAIEKTLVSADAASRFGQYDLQYVIVHTNSMRVAARHKQEKRLIARSKNYAYPWLQIGNCKSTSNHN